MRAWMAASSVSLMFWPSVAVEIVLRSIGLAEPVEHHPLLAVGGADNGVVGRLEPA